MTVSEKKDLIRLLGEELYRLYKLGTISTFHEYDTSRVTSEGGIQEIVNEFYVEPYRRAIDNGADLMEELQYVLGVIRLVVKEYDSRKKEDAKQLQDGFSLTVQKALMGDTGAPDG